MNPNRPAEVRPAEDLAELARRINAEHDAGEGASRKGLEHFRAAGEALLKAKKQCGHGSWLPWVKAHLRFGDRQARKYMRLAREWESVKSELGSDMGLSSALRRLTEDVEEPAPSSDPVYSKTLWTWLDRIVGQPDQIEVEEGGIEAMLTQRDKWDWRDVRNNMIPRLESLCNRLTHYLKEVQRAAAEAE